MTGWLAGFVAFMSVVGAVVTAVATIMLWRVTKLLAVETKRMADASRQPHVVATIEPSRWSLIHAELRVENTGNATAYDIQVSFDPPLQNGESRANQDVPFQRVSLLKPGQSMASYLSEFGPLLDNAYRVTITWKRDPAEEARETNLYDLDLSPLRNITQLGASDPMVQIAEQMKKLREDWQWVAGGSRKIGVDVHTSADRLHERRQRERFRRSQRRAQPGADGE